MDFDDLIGMPLTAVAVRRAKWQVALGHILVDEYQDTNATQYEVLKALAGSGGSTAVGDDDQSMVGAARRSTTCASRRSTTRSSR